MNKSRGYYIAATPETVRSVVRYGVFPGNLPDYVVPNSLQIINLNSGEIVKSHTQVDQTFIIELSEKTKKS